MSGPCRLGFAQARHVPVLHTGLISRSPAAALGLPRIPPKVLTSTSSRRRRCCWCCCSSDSESKTKTKTRTVTVTDSGVVSKQVLVPARSPTRHLDPQGPCPLSLQAPGPARTLYKAISATRGCPRLSPVAKVGDLADTRKQFRHENPGGLHQAPPWLEAGIEPTIFHPLHELPPPVRDPWIRSRSERPISIWLGT
jgi:hypothetical protein